jgi:hypothetical protein
MMIALTVVRYQAGKPVLVFQPDSELPPNPVKEARATPSHAEY